MFTDCFLCQFLLHYITYHLLPLSSFFSFLPSTFQVLSDGDHIFCAIPPLSPHTPRHPPHFLHLLLDCFISFHSTSHLSILFSSSPASFSLPVPFSANHKPSKQQVIKGSILTIELDLRVSSANVLYVYVDGQYFSSIRVHHRDKFQFLVCLSNPSQILFLYPLPTHAHPLHRSYCLMFCVILRINQTNQSHFLDTSDPRHLRRETKLSSSMPVVRVMRRLSHRCS